MVDWLVEHEKLPLLEALQRVKGDLKESAEDKAKRKETQRLAKLLTQKVEAFFNACVQRYQLLQFAEGGFKAAEIDYTEPFYRWIRQGVRFYDALTDRFILADFKGRVSLMREYKNSYFFKLQPGVTVYERI